MEEEEEVSFDFSDGVAVAVVVVAVVLIVVSLLLLVVAAAVDPFVGLEATGVLLAPSFPREDVLLVVDLLPSFCKGCFVVLLLPIVSAFGVAVLTAVSSVMMMMCGG